MIRNAAGQHVGAQMITAADGTAFTGSVTVSVTGNAGTQATGSVGSGACVHEGNGFHTYAPAAAETNYAQVAFTFTGTGAVPTTVQIYPEDLHKYGIKAFGTAQSASSTGVVLAASEAFADDVLIGNVIAAYGSTQGYWQERIITDNALSGDSVTVPTWTVTPSGTVTYVIYGSAPGMAAADVGTAVWAAGTRTLTAGTNIALAKGTGVTGFNDLSAAQVNAEVDTALTDIHLDHLLAADYDPASKPGVSTALFNELIESDGGVSRYTTNALEQGPAGGGGGGLDAAGVRAAVGLASANLDTQLGALPTAAENAAEVLSAAASNPIDANIEEVNNIQLQGVGTSGNPWRPA